MAEKHNKSYIFEVELKYDLAYAKLTALDFSSFPQLRQVQGYELSEMQREEYSKAKTNLNIQPPKLISDCNNDDSNSVISEHVENLLYILIWFSGEIVRVKRCVKFTTYPFLREYCMDMAEKRASSPSKIQKSLTKLMTNSLAG